MKLFKVMAVGMLVLGAMAMSGCGGDKYTGKWYKSNGPEAIDYQQLDIQKNGSGFVIDSNDFSYEQRMIMLNSKEHEESKQMGGAFLSRKEFSKAMHRVIPPVYDVKVQWTKKTRFKNSAVLKDGNLILDDGGKIVYVEKNNTLLYNGKTYKSEKDFKPKDVQEQLKKKIETGIEEMRNLKNKVIYANQAPVIQKVEIYDELPK
ncbi:MAG: hypothetical protein SOV56_01645 [Phascolarctobacterium sp.]|nr:hypothetical protein [Phascolarctobacterium sp.]